MKNALHTFVDVSQNAYGEMVYMRVECEDQTKPCSCQNKSYSA